jgi:predicted Zn-dependent protease
MTFSIAAKQNFVYFILVIITSLGTVLLYWNTQAEWMLYRNAETKYRDKDYESAIGLYKKSLEAGAPSSRVILNLANSYLAVGNFKEAIVLYKEHLVKNPKDTNVRLELARALSYIGNLKESEMEYKKTLEDSH